MPRVPFEFIVEGPPVSYRSKNREALRRWRDKVRDGARARWPPGAPPLEQAVKLTMVYYHEGKSPDTDNLEKPIRDALNGLVYVEDHQITDSTVRKTSLLGLFRVAGMSPVLAEGFVRGRQFLYIRIDAAPSHEDLL